MGRHAACGHRVLVLAAAGARVLLVGSYNGIRGQYKTIQAAVDAAKPSDWILVGPGDYKTTSFRAPKGAAHVPRRRPDHEGRHLPAGHEPQHGDRRRHEAGLGDL